MTAEARASGREIVLVAALSLLWLAATAGLRPLMLPDEGRYAGVAWEMLRSGDWLTPTLNGLPYFHKPPLFYWITAGSFALFGANELVARTAPILGGAMAAVSLYLFARRWSGIGVARASLVALGVQPLFFIGAQFANLDMLVAGCISASILLFAHAALSREQGQAWRPALLGAYAVTALGVLAKGLIGVVLPLLVIGCWLLAGRRWKSLRVLVSPAGVLLFLVVAGPWFIAMELRFPDFLHYFFVVQHFQRFAAGGFNNVEPFWFYAVVLGLVSLPWWPWLRRLFHRAPFGAPQGGLRLLMVLWVVLVVAFFSLPQSKLVGYVLPAVPPLAFLAADGWTGSRTPGAGERRLWWAGASLYLLAALGLVVLLTVQPQRSSRELAAVLKASRAPHEPVFMLKSYEFDLPYYARLESPVIVVDDWRDPAVLARDTWRKELADAGRFDRARAATQLIEPAALPAALCAAPVSWIVAAVDAPRVFPVLAHARLAARTRQQALWRLDTGEPAVAQALQCLPPPRNAQWRLSP